MKVDQTSQTTSRAARSRSLSTRPWAVSRVLTSRRFDARRCSTTCRAERRSPVRRRSSKRSLRVALELRQMCTHFRNYTRCTRFRRLNKHKQRGASLEINSSETISRILDECRTIAVVGLSSDTYRPSNSVSAYMRRAGYRVIPVNPNETEVFGEKAYPDLASVPEKIDL